MKREEAINEIKSWAIPSEKGREVLETLIPELAESEDERIKNLIYCIVRDRSDVGKLLEANGCPVEKALSWIEEQKEPKLESCDCSRDEESYTNGIHHVLMNPEAYGLIKQKPAEQLGGTFTSYDMAKTFTEGQNYVIAHPEKFGLCKPAEWSEDWREEDIQTRFAFYTYKNAEDDGVLYLSNVFVEEASRNHGFGTKILRAAEKVAETIGATTICLKVKQDSPANAWYRKNGYGYVAFEDGYDWLEKNLEYMKPNKQEWSEDERIRKYFIWIVKNVLNNIQGLKLSEEQVRELIDNYSGIKESDMLAYLEKQKEQKPEWSDYKDKVNVPYCSSEPEWSEEDEK